MKQAEKKDIILRYLYEKRDDNQDYNLNEILVSQGVETNPTEVARLASDLKKDHYIELKDLSSVLKKARINGKGIDYCESDSYSNKGQGIVYNYHINNSPQANIIVNSNRVSINQKQHDKAESILAEIRKKLLEDESLDLQFKQEVMECLAEIKDGLTNKKAPKYAIKSLLSLVGDTASITGLALSLAKIFGFG